MPPSDWGGFTQDTLPGPTPMPPPRKPSGPGVGQAFWQNPWGQSQYQTRGGAPTNVGSGPFFQP